MFLAFLLWLLATYPLLKEASVFLISAFSHKQNSSFVFCFFLISWFFLETGFLCMALAFLDVTLYTRMAWNSEIHLPLLVKS